MRALGILTSLMVAAPALAQQQNAQASLDAVVAPLVKPDAPGCAAAASRKGKRIATQGFGMADLEHGIAITPDSVFEAGSVSKQFTAAAILTLAEGGKLALTDDVRKYLPELPDYGTSITIDHLLSHTSGLRDWGAVAMLGGWERSTRAYTNDDALRIIARQKALNYKPGAEFSYTNSGYNLMAAIVGRVSGQSLAAFSKTRLFAPLGMSHTSWRDDFRRVVKDHAIAYGPARGGGWEEQRPFENVYGNGGLLTTVGDLLIWNEALTAGKLGARLTSRLQERATLNDGRRIPYARGLTVSRYRDQHSVSHSGSTGGYRAWLERLPQTGLSIAVLCNSADLTPTAIGRQFADSQLPTPAAQAKTGIPVAPPTSRAGLYVSRTTGKPMRLGVTDGKLKPNEGPAFDDLGNGRFRAGETELVFTGAQRFRMSTADGQISEFDRTAPFAPDAAVLTNYAGRYASDEAGAAYDVAVDGAGIRLTLVDRPAQVTHLVPIYGDAFESGDMLVRFRRNATGKATGLSIGISRVRDLRFARMP